jgi:hypothetical protein
MTRATVFIFLMLSGPWLVRLIVRWLRHSSLTNDRVPPFVFAILMGVGTISSVFFLLAGLVRGSVICFGRNCPTEIYRIAGSPMEYWMQIGALFFVAVFMCSIAVVSFLQARDQR